MVDLYNSLTQKIEPFKPSAGKEVRMYTCGPSTYQPAHIGNFRTFLFEDVLQRYLEYLGYNIKRVMTLTDIEDKAIEQAKKENLTVEEITQRNEAIFFKDFELLKIKKPTYPIRASTAVDQSVKLVEQLIKNGTAYRLMHNGEENIYFDPLRYGGFGKLSHLDMSKWPKNKRHFHKDTYPGTPWNRGDFILWHGCKGEGDVCFQTPIGKGRPSWNIQDAAIVTKQLGFTVDLGCGGIDNLVRHHDYTLAIAEAVSGKTFSKFWMHGGHLFVEGKKMSKSKGNVYYPKDIIAKGYSGQQLRFFLIYRPYRKKLNFTYQKLATVTQRLNSLRDMIAYLHDTEAKKLTKQNTRLTDRIVSEFEECMNNDLDVKSAIDKLFETVTEICKRREYLGTEEKKNVLRKLQIVDSVLQCLF
jgi:cysteinyl-tRNA synthetase